MQPLAVTIHFNVCMSQDCQGTSAKRRGYAALPPAGEAHVWVCYDLDITFVTPRVQWVSQHTLHFACSGLTPAIQLSRRQRRRGALNSHSRHENRVLLNGVLCSGVICSGDLPYLQR